VIRRLTAVIPIVLATAACEEARVPVEAPECGEDAAPVAIEDFCSRYHRALCLRERACARFGDRPTPYDDCAIWSGIMAPACEADWGTLATTDETRYSPADAGRCIACLETLSCWHLAAAESGRVDCLQQAFQGTGAAGAACHDDLGCQRGLVCDLETGCPGTCVEDDRPRRDLAEGATCGGGAGTCGLGLYCNDGGDGQGTCAPWRREDQTCGGGHGECKAYELWCRKEAADEQTGTCVPVPGPGEECTEALGLSDWCRGSVCDPATGTCILARQIGDRCASDDVCTTWRCDETQRCGPILPPEDPCPLP